MRVCVREREIERVSVGGCGGGVGGTSAAAEEGSRGSLLDCGHGSGRLVVGRGLHRVGRGRVEPVDYLLDGLELAADRRRLRVGGRGHGRPLLVVVPLRRREGRLPGRRERSRRRLLQPAAVGGRLEVERRRRRRAARRRAPAGRHRLERRADGRRIVVQAQVVRVKPAQSGQAAGGHLERVIAAAGTAAGRGALQVRLREQRARMVSGQRQLSVEQQVGGGTERGRAQGPAQARGTGVHAGVQVRQQVRRRWDWRSERHVR